MATPTLIPDLTMYKRPSWQCVAHVSTTAHFLPLSVHHHAAPIDRERETSAPRRPAILPQPTAHPSIDQLIDRGKQSVSQSVTRLGRPSPCRPSSLCRSGPPAARGDSLRSQGPALGCGWAGRPGDAPPRRSALTPMYSA
eukprot:Selendium_serpulae@DN7834_c0_g1_i1.p1